ncbi:MAG: hypothetical protein R3C49_23800, partial [Planctomycetaceae bacterium]
WCLSLADGLSFRQMPGADQDVFHIGGTSYMHRTDYPPEHWDYWPTSVRYFNLRLLERPELARFRSRFETMFRTYRTADGLLTAHPKFLDSRRYEQMNIILDFITNRQ